MEREQNVERSKCAFHINKNVGNFRYSKKMNIFIFFFVRTWSTCKIDSRKRLWLYLHMKINIRGERKEFKVIRHYVIMIAYFNEQNVSMNGLLSFNECKYAFFLLIKFTWSILRNRDILMNLHNDITYNIIFIDIQRRPPFYFASLASRLIETSGFHHANQYFMILKAYPKDTTDCMKTQ